MGITKRFERSVRRGTGTAMPTKTLLSAPEGLGYTPPFKVYNVGPQSYVTDFDPDDYIVESSVTYYLSPSGNDANDGLSAGLAKKSIKTLVAALNASPPVTGATLYLAPGNYFNEDAIDNQSLDFNCNIICQSGKAIIARVQTPNWTYITTRTNLWRSDAENQTRCVIDLADIDAFGIPARLRFVADAATADATPRSFFATTTAIGVHLFDSREADGNVVIISPSALPYISQASGRQLFVKNVEFWGGRGVIIDSGTDGGRCVFSGCSLSYTNGTSSNGFETIASGGGVLTIMHNVIASYCHRDGFGYRGGQAAVEIECKAVWNGYRQDGGSDNGSTSHLSVKSVRVNGVYRHNDDRNIHDIGTSKNWIIGGSVGNAQNASVDKYDNANVIAGRRGETDATTSWIEGMTCTGGSASDLAAYGGSQIETFGNVGFAITDTDGTATIAERV